MIIKIWLVVLNLSTDGKTVKPNSTNVAKYLKDHVVRVQRQSARSQTAEIMNQLMSIGGMLECSRSSSAARSSKCWLVVSNMAFIFHHINHIWEFHHPN